MPKFSVTFDGMGFTRRKELLDLEMEPAPLALLNAKLREAGKFPSDILAVLAVGTSADGKEDGEWKVFTPVKLLVEADDEDDAQNMDTSEDELEALLLAAVSALIKEDAEDALGMEDGFEVLDVEEVAADEPLPG